jgi:hypothetical protein
MSKFNIQIDTGPYGEQWLDALYFNYYLFLSKKLVPSPEERTYLEESYKNIVSEGVTFGYYKLTNSRNKTEIEGYGLRKKGPYISGDFFCLNELKELIAEPKQRTREFETIVSIETEFGRDYNLTPARNGHTWGIASINFEYTILKRAISIHEKWHNKKYYDYYDIPDDEDIMNYIPLEKDFKYTKEYYKNEKSGENFIIPYTHETGELLDCIIQGSCKIGELLFKLLKNIENINSKLTFQNMLLLSDKPESLNDRRKKQ